MPITSLGVSVVTSGKVPGAAVVPNDSDAQAFIDVIGTLTQPEQAAINDLVVGLKADNLWTSLLYIWPLVGNQNAQRYNLRNPATGLITWNGTGTHDTATGYTPGADGYGNTGLAGGAVTITTSAFGAYIRNDSVNASSVVMGCDQNAHYLIARDGFQRTRIGNVTNTSAAVAQTEGLIVANRSAGNVALYKNGISIGGTGPHAGTTPTTLMFLGAVNDGTDVVLNTSHAEAQSFGMFCFGFISDHALFYTHIQQFQTDLGRQV